MNFFGINGGSFNGAIYAWVLASASLSCTAGISATAIRQQDALAPTFSSASLTSAPTVYRYVAADLSGLGNVYPGVVTHQQACYSNLTGGSECVAYVLNTVYATTTVYSVAEMTAVVASSLGSAALSGGASILTKAQRIQFVTNGVAGSALLNILAEPVRIQFGDAAVIGVEAKFRNEPSTKTQGEGFKRHDGYAFVIGIGNVITSPVRFVKPVADLTGDASTLVLPKLVYGCNATGQAIALTVLAEPHIEITPFARPTVGATLVVTGTRVVKPSLAIFAPCTSVFSPVQKHAAQSTLAGTATVASNSYVLRYVVANIVNEASCSAIGIKLLIPRASLLSGASLSSAPVGYGKLNAGLTGTAGLYSDAVVTRYAYTAMALLSDLESTPTILKLPEALVTNSCEIEQQPSLTIWIRANLNMGCYLDIFCDTVANPESYDPDYRTFISPLRDTNVIRPFVETEFKRAA